MPAKLTPKQRLELVKKALSGESIVRICQEAGVSRTLLYRWIKRYNQTQAGTKISAIKAKSKRTKKIENLTEEVIKQILSLILLKPETYHTYISQKITDFKIGRNTVYAFLKHLKLNSLKKRRKFKQDLAFQEQILKSVIEKYLTKIEPKVLLDNIRPQDRLEMIERVKAGVSVKRVCQLYGVSRTIFYRWLRRYGEAPEGQKLEALWDRKPTVEKYYNQASQEYEEAVLSAVREYPELSSHKLVWVLPQIGGRPILGNHGVQNVLRRHNLSTYQQRLAFSEAYRKPTASTRFFGIFQSLLDFVGKKETGKRKLYVRATAATFLGIFALVIVLGSVSLFKLIFGGPSFAYSIGTIFALSALTIGMFFFLYSLKYYITIAMVLSFSRYQEEKDLEEVKEPFFSSFLTSFSKINKGSQIKPGLGLMPDLADVVLSREPFVSIHLVTYNEKRVIDRLLTAATSQEYENYEVILVDDSTDESIDTINKWKDHPRVKIIHRDSRVGYKGGALQKALEITSPKSEFVLVFDADFIPYPDTITQFLKYFKATIGSLDKEAIKNSKIAAVQGYQWHVLNKSENWITRGVRAEYAGSYVVERSGEEIYGGLKQIAGSVYILRIDALKKIGWGTSITEDFQLTLKLYEKGYKVIFTPYIQAPSECVSTIKRLIRQRMRWAEGHSHNIKKMFFPLMKSQDLTVFEKFELLYLAPYYLQSALFIIGTLSWFISEVVFQVSLPFWTSTWGWSLVFTNLLALPLMNMVGLFLEESNEKDYLGLWSFVVLSYILAPFQGYAAIKGFLSKEEGPWFRTPKTGHITDVFDRGRFYRFVTGIFGAKAKVPAHVASTTQISYAYTLNHYVSLSTANNTFSQSEQESPAKKPAKWISRLALAFCLILSILAYDGIKTNSPDKKGSLGIITALSKLKKEDVNLTAAKETFSYTEKPTFTLSYDPDKLKNSSPLNKIISSIKPKEAIASEQKVKAELFYKGSPADKIAVIVDQKSAGKFDIKLEPEGAIKPGKYTLKTTVTQADNTYKSQQDFRWGVLALNTQKPLYKSGETIKFGFGVVDDAGNTICDADLKLIISVPSENKDYKLSSKNGSIKNSGQCSRESVTNTADYLAEFKAKDKEEVYKLHIVANTLHGERSFDDQIKITNNVPFDINRNSYPTRIYPKSPYPVEITIIPNQDLQGEVIENLPPGFQALEISDSGFLDDKGSVNDLKTPRSITWKVNWKKGGTYKLSYTVLFPLISPEFYLVGPLRFQSGQSQAVFEEPRRWQIAADAIAFVQISETFGLSTSCAPSLTGVAAGNLLVLGIPYGSATATISSISDSAGDTFTLIDSNQGNSTSTFLYYKENATAGTHTVTVNFSTTVGNQCHLAEYSGIATSSSLDKHVCATGSSTAPASGTVTTTQANELLYAEQRYSASANTVTAGTSYTKRSTNTRAIAEDRIVSATGTYNGDATIDPSLGWTACIATFSNTAVPETGLLLLAPFLYIGIYLLKKRRKKLLKRQK